MLECLYYQEKSEETIYSSNPPGQPIVERFINGEDKYWQKDDISPKRILIFSPRTKGRSGIIYKTSNR